MARRVGGVRADPMANQMTYLKVNITHDKSASAGGGARCTDWQHDAQKNYVSTSPCLGGNEQHPLLGCTSGGGCHRVRMLMLPPRRQYHHRLDLMLTRDAVISPLRRHLLVWLIIYIKLHLLTMSRQKMCSLSSHASRLRVIVEDIEACLYTLGWDSIIYVL